MVISERLRRLGKLGAMLWFGALVFAFVFYLSLPYARFKDLLASRLAPAGFVLEAKHAGPSLGLGMTLEEVTLVSQSAGAAKPTRILIDKATFGVSMLSYLFGTKSFSLAADVFKGELEVSVRSGKKDAAATLKASELDLAEVPWAKSALNLPTSGKMDIDVDLALPNQRASEAKGQVRWSCTACALGDGKAKLTIASNPLLAEGLGLPKIRLGDFTGKVAIDKGVGRLQGVQFKSQDLEATVEGEIHLAQPLATSRVDLYVRFKLSDTLLRSSEKLRTIMDFTAQMGKRPDGFLGFRVSGTFANLGTVQWLKSSPFASTAPPVPPVKPAPPPRPVPPPVAPAAPPAPPPVVVPAAPPAAPPVVAAPPPPPPPTPPPPPPPPTPNPAPVAAAPTSAPVPPPPSSAPPPAAPIAPAIPPLPVPPAGPAPGSAPPSIPPSTTPAPGAPASPAAPPSTENEKLL